MYKLLYLLFFIHVAVLAPAQSAFKVLFVDDSADGFSNSEFVYNTLNDLGYENLYVDAIGQGITPTAEDMSQYNLVIWHTSTWGGGLQLWGGGDSVNTELVTYLSLPEANLWLIGLDYLFDRYGTAPITFQPGDFAYDYLGIAAHNAQSYADDGGLGVPFVTPAANQPIDGLTDIFWQFSTLWYADAFELRPEATPVYQFGGAGYVLNGSNTGHLFTPVAGGRVLVYGFDLALANTFDAALQNVSSVLKWWEKVSATQAPNATSPSVRIAPNTFSDHLDIAVQFPQTGLVNIDLYNATGQLVSLIAREASVQAGEDRLFRWVPTTDLPNGVYYCSVQSGEQVRVTKVVRQGR